MTKHKKKNQIRNKIPNGVKQELRCLSSLSVNDQAQRLVETFNYTLPAARNIVKSFRGIRQRA